MNEDVIDTLVSNRRGLGFLSSIVYGKATTIISSVADVNGSSIGVSEFDHNTVGEGLLYIGWARVDEVSNDWAPVTGYNYYMKSERPSFNDIEVLVGIDDTVLRFDILNLNAFAITVRTVIWLYVP